MNRLVWICLAVSFSSVLATAQETIEVAPPPRRVVPPGPVPVDVVSFLRTSTNPMKLVLERYEADRGSLARTYFVPASPVRTQRFVQFQNSWLEALSGQLAQNPSEELRLELARLHAQITREQQSLLTEAAKRQAVRPLIPFGEAILELEDARRGLVDIIPRQKAGQLDQLAKQVRQTRQTAEDSLKSEAPAPYLKPSQLRFAQGQVEQLSAHLKTWFDFYNGYDPLFSWWMAEPFKDLSAALMEYRDFLRASVSGQPDTPWTIDPLPMPKLAASQDAPDLNALLKEPLGLMPNVLQRYSADRGGRRVPGGAERGRGSDRAEAWLRGLAQVEFDQLSLADQVDYLLLKNMLKRDQLRQQLSQRNLPTPKAPRDGTGIVGRPIGAEALALELQLEMVPYQASELIAIAEEEYEWCLKEMKAASRELGFGDDWKAAMEHVKQSAVDPGDQPKMVRELALEAIEYLNQHRLVTVSPLAAETWRMTMMSPQQQLFSPFFLGGETIIVAYPTHTMSHDAKLQSMRGNNPHFSRATVQHELIPGHHLQGFQGNRYATHRRMFRTPLWPEGMAVYWEMILYDRGFPRGPEDRIGMMFWRMHRCARVIFSFGYHLGQMTPQQCIDFLVDKAGHERDNATAEVRRSFTGGYGPLYQAAYQIGAMQFRALRHELVDSGKLSERDFHDALYQLGPIPVEMIRATLTQQKLTPDFQTRWRFIEPKAKNRVVPQP